MSDAAEALVVAFQDGPSLLAVRLRLPTSTGARFAAGRRADAAVGGNAGAVGCLVVAGVLAAVVLGNIDGCSSSPGRPPPPALSSVRHADAAENAAWSSRLPSLADAFEPVRADLRPWAVRSLLDVPREIARGGGDATGGWLRPACTGEDEVVRRRAAALARQLRAAGEVAGTAVIIDLPGASSVAAAVGLADDFAPVVAIDNLPHPQGVVPAAQTLAAAVFWRPEIERARARRAADAPPCFVLEGDRLAPYANQPERFDNRSTARLPDAAALAALGVRRVVYLRPHRGAVQEADDLNALLVALPAAGVQVRHLGLDALDAADEQVEAGPSAGPHPVAPSWLWLAGRDRDGDYRAQARPFAATARLDGGAGSRETVLGALRPAPPRPASSGGSWMRSFSLHGGGS